MKTAKRTRPSSRSTSVPKYQKMASEITSQRSGSLATGHVAMRQICPSRTRSGSSQSLSSTGRLGPSIAHTNMLTTHVRMTKTVVVTSSVPIRNHGSLGPRRPGTEIEKRPVIAATVTLAASPATATARSVPGPRRPPQRSGATQAGAFRGHAGRRGFGASVSSDSMIRRPPAGTIPDAPGSYQFKDAAGRIIYVGKASSLRQRLSNYFSDPNSLPVRTRQMVALAESVEWTTVRNEVEALMLEYSLIKAHDPRFNVRLRDDKSYPFLAVTVDEQFPRAMVMRGRKRKGTRYFGPYAHAYAIRETLDELLRSFPIRTCSPAKFQQHHRLGRPCLLYHIEKCSGPCVGEIDEVAHRQLVDELCEFLDGDTAPIMKRLDREMRDAAATLEFEKAARLRDRLTSVRRAIERQQMVADRNEDIDIIGLADDDLEASVQVFYVRRGRVVGRNGFVLDKVEDLTPGGLLDRILEQLYGEDPPQGVPKLVLVPSEPEELELYQEWLSLLRGSRVAIRVPQRGDRRALLQTVTNNAREAFNRHRLRRAGDHNSRSKALTELQEHLDLAEAPLRIECYDMAHLQGTDYVGSMVVLEDGLPNKREYRRFKVNVPGNDDYAAMREVLTRRLRAYLAARREPVVPGETGRQRPAKFSYPPQLLLVDGGKGQLRVAEEVVGELGLAAEIPVAGLAKRFEQVFVPGRSDPVDIPRGSEALFMLQRIRDEAHRFANTFHAERRSKRMTRSNLDGIAGLGETRRKRLVKELGGVAAVKQASLEQLRSLPWLPDKVAAAVHERFHDGNGDAVARSAADPSATWRRAGHVALPSTQRRAASEDSICANTTSSTVTPPWRSASTAAPVDAVGHRDDGSPTPCCRNAATTLAAIDGWCDRMPPPSTTGPATSGETTARHVVARAAERLGDDLAGRVVAARRGVERQSGAARELDGLQPVDGVDELPQGDESTVVSPFGGAVDAELGEHEIDEGCRRPATVERARRLSHHPSTDPETGTTIAQQPAQPVARRDDPRRPSMRAATAPVPATMA